MRFVWDPVKARVNRKKHNVSFEEAITVFLDSHALLIHDPDHSSVEDRWILLGLSQWMRALVVIHSEKEADVIRIISARKANKNEIKLYAEMRS